MATPDVAKTEILEASASTPAGESNVYTLEGEGTCLIGTAEITLGGYHSGAVFEKDQLPIRFAGLSHCFRREAGRRASSPRALPVHQFTKVECSCTACLRTRTHARELRSIEEEIFTSLVFLSGRRYCTGDLGAPAYRKWDLEAWMPGRNNGEWGEITSRPTARLSGAQAQCALQGLQRGKTALSTC